jgi:hypothetical protein
MESLSLQLNATNFYSVLFPKFVSKLSHKEAQECNLLILIPGLWSPFSSTGIVLMP